MFSCCEPVLVSQVMAGAYTYLPMGLRSLSKAAQIVREEMNRAGAVELVMPAMSPISLWDQTGRTEAFGDVLVKLDLPRSGRKVRVVLGPTHEEIITDLVSRQISSYPADADHALPDPEQVPQRGATPVRRVANERIPHEGRLQFRHRR